MPDGRVRTIVMTSAVYDVFAIQYATSIRSSAEYFLEADAHDGPAPINYYIWAIRNEERVIVVDTGFDAARAVSRKRDFIRCPIEGLRSLGIEARDVETVIISHLHYDHAGNLDKFPHARFVLQDEEMCFATGRSMRFRPMRAPFDLSDVLAMVSFNYQGRERFANGTETVAPGIVVYHVPGHTPKVFNRSRSRPGAGGFALLPMQRISTRTSLRNARFPSPPMLPLPSKGMRWLARLPRAPIM